MTRSWTLLAVAACAPRTVPPAVPAVPPPPPAAEPPPPPPPPAWIDDAVTDALEWEVMPGTDGEPEPGRAEELRAFFTTHPQYADAETREGLADGACGLGGVEAAHERLQAPPTPEPLVVEVEGDDWAVVIGHVDVLCTSDDWAYYSHEAMTAAEELGATVGYANADVSALVVRSSDRELARVPLEGQGFLGLKAGGEPTAIGYDPGAPDSLREWLESD